MHLLYFLWLLLGGGFGVCAYRVDAPAPSPLACPACAVIVHGFAAAPEEGRCPWRSLVGCSMAAKDGEITIGVSAIQAPDRLRSMKQTDARPSPSRRGGFMVRSVRY